MGFNVKKAVSSTTKKVTQPVQKAYTSVTAPIANAMGMGPKNDPMVKGISNAAKTAASTASGANAKPAGPTYSSILNGNGVLQDKYKVANPTDIRATTVSADALKSGGTLTPQQIAVQKLMSGGTLQAGKLGDYADVNVNSMMGDAQGRLDAVQTDTRGLDALRDRALGEGPSAWAKLQQQKLDMQRQDALNASAKSQAGAMANAMSNVAMRGGLSSGANLRAAKQAAQDQALAAQQIRRQGQMDSLNLGIADENQRLDVLKQLPGMDLAFSNQQLAKANALNDIQGREQGLTLNADLANRQALMSRDMYNADKAMDASKFNITNAQDVSKFNIGTALDKDKYNASNKLAADQFNITNAQDVNKFNISNAYDARKFNSTNELQTKMYNTTNDINNAQYNMTNTLGGVQNKNAFDMDKYKMDMAAWAAGKQANAISNSGKK